MNSSCSPIVSTCSGDDSWGSDTTTASGKKKKSSTKLSMDMDKCELSKKSSVDTSQESRNFAQLTQNWNYAAADAGVSKRSSSLPPYLNRISLKENTFFLKCPYKREISLDETPAKKRSNSVGDMSLSPWNDDEAFMRFKREQELS